MLIVYSDAEDLVALSAIESTHIARTTIGRMADKSIDVIANGERNWGNTLSIARDALDLILASFERDRETIGQSYLPSTSGRKHAMKIACK